MTEHALALVREMRGKVCICGQPKGERRSFCRDCYYCLSILQRSALYRLLGQGYEEAYESAIHALYAAGRIGKKVGA